MLESMSRALWGQPAGSGHAAPRQLGTVEPNEASPLKISKNYPPAANQVSPRALGSGDSGLTQDMTKCKVTEEPSHAQSVESVSSFNKVFGGYMIAVMKQVQDFSAQNEPKLSHARAAEIMRRLILKDQEGQTQDADNKASMLYALYGIREAATAHKSLAPLLAATPEFRSLQTGQAWRMLMDQSAWGDGQHAGLRFDNEPGYMGAMYRGLGQVLKAHRDKRTFDLSLLKDLHQTATAGVYQKRVIPLYPESDGDTQRKAADRTRPANTAGTYLKKSEDSFHIKVALRDSDSHACFVLNATNLSPVGLREFFANQTLHSQPAQSMVCTKEDTSGMRYKIRSPSDWDGRENLYMVCPKQDSQSNEAMADKIIALYGEEVRQATTHDAKLSVIARCVQRLAQLHLFMDGNARTHGFLVVNKLLLEQALPPTMIADPNRFDALSVDELVQDIQQGQHTFTLYCQPPPAIHRAAMGSSPKNPIRRAPG